MHLQGAQMMPIIWQTDFCQFYLKKSILCRQA